MNDKAQELNDALCVLAEVSVRLPFLHVDKDKLAEGVRDVFAEVNKENKERNPNLNILKGPMALSLAKLDSLRGIEKPARKS